jgi:hypothetical protein
LEEAGKFAAGVLDPINRAGDVQGVCWKDGVVNTAAGFKGSQAELPRSWLEWHACSG